MRQRKPSPQTLLVLQALLIRPADWRHGYDLTKQIGVKAGTLYPVLMRLTDQGLLESEWHEPGRLGAPPRHAYRLTHTGLAYALESVDAARRPGTGMMLPA
jgi:DNA-binding PadR family transcriptional regulator